MELNEKFEKAVTDSKLLPAKPSNEILLQLYSLYKQSVQGDVDVPPPANPFDIVAAAKHQAWSALKGMQREDAMQQYVALVDKLRS
jgi:diazepam-binding inhibitor (GABA receptor modulating acyl-CoA-binding protein)